MKQKCRVRQVALFVKLIVVALCLFERLGSGNHYCGRAGVRAEKSKLFDSDACGFKLSSAAGVKFHTFSENARTPASAHHDRRISTVEVGMYFACCIKEASRYIVDYE